MSSEIIFEARESPEGGYEARAIGYSIFTEADSLDELRSMVRYAVRCHFDDSPLHRHVGLRFTLLERTPRRLGIRA